MNIRYEHLILDTWQPFWRRGPGETQDQSRDRQLAAQVALGWELQQAISGSKFLLRRPRMMDRTP